MDTTLRNKNRRRFLIATVILVCNLILYVIAISLPLFCETYLIPAGYLFLMPIKKIVDLIPFSLSELILVIALPLTLLLIIARAICRKNRRKAGSIQTTLTKLFLLISILYLLYNLALGFPAHRNTIPNTMNWKASEKPEETLVKLTEYLAAKANEERSAFSSNWPDDQTMNSSLKTAYITSAEIYPFVLAQPSVPKKIILSRLMSYTQTSGIFIPFFAESNVNIDEPVFAFPYTAAHEMAHSVLVAREADANMTAFLVCKDANLPEVRYSADFFGILYCFNALAADDLPEFKRIYASLSPEVKQDYQDYGEHVRKYEGKVAEFSQKINDLYIKATGQPEGIKSYGEVVDQLILWYANK